MGAVCSSTGEELPAATEEMIKALRDKGHLPCVAVPSEDLVGNNNLTTVYVAEYENGTELTFLFLDEDRPNICEDCFYDTIRRPLFGRWSDIESVLIINDEVEFPGTYAKDQKWNEKMPQHNHATIELSKFERNDDNEFILWVNTWNHLLGEANNNTEKEISYGKVCPAGSTENEQDCHYVLRIGCRSEVDLRFKGCITSVADVITEVTAKKLGKRIR